MQRPPQPAGATGDPPVGVTAALAKAGATFAARFGRRRPGDLRYAFAPYRVCPLGAHVDHQDGAVTGMAIDQGIAVAFARRADRRVRAVSADFPGEVGFDLRDIPPAQPGDWGNFLRGAAAVLQTGPSVGDDGQASAGGDGESGTAPLERGVDLAVAGQLPIGGLSSSAAVAISYVLALAAASERPITPETTAALVHRVENEYVGLRSGVLDQSMILFARQDRLLHLDCRSGAREYVALGEGPAEQRPDQQLDARPTARPTARPPLAIAVAYSGLAQALVGTGYNQRVAECREAATRLLDLAGRSIPPGGARLRDVPPDLYRRHGDALPAPLARRAAHYFGEQARVAAGREAWRAGDLHRFGQLVTESGRSSIEKYECGAPELVTLYQALVATPGVYGARFSGAGFRGACLALVDPAAFDAIAAAVRARYLAPYPHYAATFGFFHCASGPAAGLIPPPLEAGAFDSDAGPETLDPRLQTPDTE